MHELGVRSNTAHKKSARIVGEVLGKYHPHGDTSVYDTMVRMAQEWSLRYMLVDGQGNFGSIDGDSPAAMRYTEARMRKISEDMLADIDKETVDHKLNFDDTLKEPTVLPTRIPGLLVNGASGIAVGMATNMPPHNLSEVVDGITAYIDDNSIEIDALMQHVKAPDFPTGGIIYGYDGVKEAFETGRGRIVIRAKANIEEVNGRECIIVSEIPYQVNKADMIKKTADLVNDKKLEGISTIRDESDRNGMRIVYVLKRDAIPNIVLNKLFKYTALQSSFSVNNIALVNGRPEMLNLKDMIHHFVEHRHEVVVRRTKYELRKAEERAHILEGLIIASDNIDEVIKIIRGSSNPDEAREKLIKRFELSDIQAKAIVEMRLRQLTGLEQDKLRSEYEDLMETIENLKDILDKKDRRMQIIKDELLVVKDKYGDERRSVIEYAGGDLSIEDMIPNEQVVITISHAGYIKRTSLTEYRTQNRGGVGQKASTTRNEDFLEHLFVGTNHQYMLFFTQKGKCFWMRVYEIPEGSKTSKGRAIQNLINIEQDDKVKAFICTQNLKDEDYINAHYVIMATKKGQVKKTSLEQYSRPRTNGINAITIREGDELLEAKLTTGESQVMLALKSGKAIRFEEAKTRPMGRGASGVRGITLAHEEDAVIGMISVNDMESNILVVSENGYGKRSSLEDYRITNRGGKGVKTISITDKTGHLVSIKNVTDEDDLMIINKSGIAIRMAVEDLRVMGRATQGVKLINLKGSDSIAAVAKVMKEEEEESDESAVETEGSDVQSLEANASENNSENTQTED
jgi:DNA gyrase subunit A